MIDVMPHVMAEVRRILAEHVPECEVRAFGSRVGGEAKPYSDLDLAVVGQEKIDRSRLARLKEAFEESNIPFRVDIVDWCSISESFRGIISARCETIQNKK
ncbi:MAG: nucleotidyltransferase domain-containing protein [Pseudomonadota bacterium]